MIQNPPKLPTTHHLTGALVRGVDRHQGLHVDETVLRAAHARVDNFLRKNTVLAGSIRWGMSPLKEMTESLAVWETLQRWAHYHRRTWDDPTVRVAVIGDGAFPRTAALVAGLTSWTVFSVDPVLNLIKAKGVNVQIIKARAEDIPRLEADYVLAVHSHATVEGTRRHARVGGTIIALPCCVAWPLHPGCEHWVDRACLSPDRRIVVERRP